ncbi:MAG: polyisoprenoid-binding protein [Hyphomicrobium sp.]|nr:polyisoprenoid-binding protein [Hyphomicrobium sp.]PPC80194.1 MAG: polyisoprenoid-binding protein [Hyphomicrobium sp.]
MNRFAPVAAAASLLFAAAPAIANPLADVPAGVYKVDPVHNSVTWRVSHLGLSNYTARFTSVEAAIELDPAKTENSKLTVSIDPTSVKTDYPYSDKKNFDKVLAEDKIWFNASVHKAITFKSSKIEMTGPKTAKVTGDLTLLGVTKPITLDATLNGAMKEQPFAKKPALGFSASGQIKRSEFGMSTYVPLVGDEVTLLIEAEFLKD